MSDIRVAIAGASGRMGRMLIEAVLNAEGVALGAAFDRAGTPFVGRDAGEMAGVVSGIAIVDDVRAAIAAADCIAIWTPDE